MSIRDLEARLLSLSPIDKLEAIQLLSRSLGNNWRGIRKTPGVCGGEACIEGTRIPVWVLTSYRQLGVKDSDQLYNYPTLTALDLANAWTYAAANPEEIEAAIQANDDDMDE
ncbi:DUF433 domain-containing protein [Leptolyngbya cf. ectocarpi LEGE 11479]|uniref:DUF433 domain-containing protein n=1 Tax=Leptolyngbya cf. ectocarpi LEGE 11479 TaxID=1828722 RepID=A0A928X283_LEPEC|nr:DUF433 domain-containing protein [Leptolyngbya ectocarpi]MBE9066031.1 DUF433 domain-containing protein [Leptolyngbya cf. ectocarpi LEGE 11479]